MTITRKMAIKAADKVVPDPPLSVADASKFFDYVEKIVIMLAAQFGVRPERHEVRRVVNDQLAADAMGGHQSEFAQLFYRMIDSIEADQSLLVDRQEIGGLYDLFARYRLPQIQAVTHYELTGAIMRAIGAYAMVYADVSPEDNVATLAWARNVAETARGTLLDRLPHLVQYIRDGFADGLCGGPFFPVSGDC